MHTRLLTALLLCLSVNASPSPAGPSSAAAKGAASNLAEPELLEPEAAFRFSAKLLDAKTLEVRYAIADGYYMYRDKFRFEAAPPAVLGKADIPKGKVKDDPNFGKVETYRKSIVVKLPVS